MQSMLKPGKPYFPPYAIIEKSGITIAVLGMVTPAIPNWLPPKIWEGIEFHDMIETAQKWVPVIQQKEKPDLIIGLFHSGVDYTYGGASAQTPKNENASKLVAQQVPGFDIIFAGHDHHGWNTTAVNKQGETVHILAASAHAIDVAAATVKMTHDESTNQWQKQISGEVVQMNKYKPDSEFMSKFDTQFEEVKSYVSQPIGTFSKTISTRDAIFGNSAFVDLVHQIQLSLTGADLSASAPLSFDARIEKGTVFVRDMFKLYKYENLLYTMSLTGWEVENFLEYSYHGWFNQMQNENDHLLKFSVDANGRLIHSKRDNAPQLTTPYFNYDSMAGLEYIVDLSKPKGQRIKILALSDGRIFDFDAIYKVAINSYRGNGGGGHLTKGSGIAQEELVSRIISSTEKDLRFFLMKWIEEQKEITPTTLGNWQILPQEWWQTAKRTRLWTIVS